jgi:CHASE2 domain-containing sensor protein/signal transduction histidine kinase
LNSHQQRKKNLRREWLLTVAISLALLAYFVFADIARPMGNVLYDHFMRMHGFNGSKDIVIVAVDDRALYELGGWPMRRERYAKLLESLDDDRYRPKAVGLDFLFLDPSPDDIQLAYGLQRFKSVLPLEFRLTDDVQQKLQPVLPVHPLSTSAALGHINLAFDSDGVIRGIHLQEQGWPHFALQLHTISDQDAPPVLQDGEYRRFRMVDPRVGFPIISLADVLHDNFTRTLLKDKYVLIGVTAPTLGDRYPTLYSGKNNASTPGVAILASVLHASLNNALIQEATPFVVFVLALVPLIIMLNSLLLLQPRHALLLAMLMMLGGTLISYLMLVWADFWIDPIPFILVAVLLQPLWAWRRLEAIVHLVGDKAADLQQFQPNERASTAVNPSREVVLQYAKILDHAVASARSELDFLSAIVDEMPDAVAIFDSHDRLLLNNQKVKEIVSTALLDAGITLAELGQHLDIPLSVLTGTQANNAVDPQQHPLFQLKTRLGEREFLLKTSTLAAPKGGHLRLVILMDVTELRQSQTQRDRALQFLSHDMRTPVASILSLTRPNPDAASLVAQRQKIIHHAKALLHMMDDFILTVSAEAQQYSFKLELLDNMLNDAIEQVADLAEVKGITWHEEAGDDSVFVMANTRLLVRAFVNLLFNAVKFSPAKSQISIHVQFNADGENGPSTTITLTNMVEIKDGAQDLIPSMPGFGLGLDFVDTVIRKHQGKITRHIPNAGKATILITLPCTTG